MAPGAALSAQRFFPQKNTVSVKENMPGHVGNGLA